MPDRCPMTQSDSRWTWRLASGRVQFISLSQSPGRQPISGVEKDNVARPKALRIALVESDDLIRALVERWLGEAGHGVRRVTLDGLKRGNGFDLIIANVPSPRSATPFIRAMQAAHSAPVLLVSARFHRGRGVSAHLAEQLGVPAVLPKPFTRDELLNAVARAMAA